MGKDYTGPLPKDIIKKGILVKAGGKDGSKSQNKRTFALGNDLLAYFTKEPFSLKTCKGCQPLTFDATCKPGPTVKGKFQFTLKNSTRHLIMFADSDGDRTSWMVEINQIIDRLKEEEAVRAAEAARQAAQALAAKTYEEKRELTNSVFLQAMTDFGTLDSSISEQMQGLSEHLKNVQEQLFTKFGDSVSEEKTASAMESLDMYIITIQGALATVAASKAQLDEALGPVLALEVTEEEEEEAEAEAEEEAEGEAEADGEGEAEAEGEVEAKEAVEPEPESAE